MKSIIFLFTFLLSSCSIHNKIKEVDYSVYVINLDRAPKRMEYVSKLLDTYHIKFNRISAIDGYKIKIKDLELGNEFTSEEIKNKKINFEYNKKYYIDCGREKEINYVYSSSSTLLTLGELGCTCSHRKVYYDFLNSHSNVAVIFEDDVKIKNNEFPFLLHSTINKIPSNSIVFMDAWGPSIEGIKRYNPQEGLFIKLKNSPKIFGLYAIVIDRKFARNLLNSSNIEEQPIDITISQKITKNQVNGFLVNKRSMSYNGELGSDINKMGRSH